MYVDVPTVRVKVLLELIFWVVGSVTVVPPVLWALEVEPGARTSIEYVPGSGVPVRLAETIAELPTVACRALLPVPDEIPCSAVCRLLNSPPSVLSSLVLLLIVD